MAGELADGDICCCCCPQHPSGINDDSDPPDPPPVELLSFNSLISGTTSSGCAKSAKLPPTISSGSYPNTLLTLGATYKKLPLSETTCTKSGHVSRSMRLSH